MKSSRSRNHRFTIAVVALCALPGAGCRDRGHTELAVPREVASGNGWPAANADLAGTRTAPDTTIRTTNVASLRLLWRFRYPGRPGFSGLAASTPLIVGSRVLVQDLNSDVYALDRASGRMLWRHRFNRPDGGPNGLAVGNGEVFGNTDRATFALDLASGRERWRTRLTTSANPITIAPATAGGLVFTATTGQRRGGRGMLVAIDAATGTVRWRFDTIKSAWRFADAYGGGAWQTPTLDADGKLYWGTANPNPWGGTPARPNGGSYPGNVPYTDSLVVLDAETGTLAWTDQVTSHDVRDLDFQNPPVLLRVAGRDLVIGAGKSGRVIAWDRSSRARVWETPVGVHRRDTGPLPLHATNVCPGFLGGVETPLAAAADRVFVPVVNLCFPESARGTSAASFLGFDYAKGTGAVEALDASTGKRLWHRRLGSAVFGCATVANDVVFTSTYDGNLYGLAASDGRVLWHARAAAGVNACPAVAANMLIVPAGTDHPSFAREPVPVLEAYAVR